MLRGIPIAGRGRVGPGPSAHHVRIEASIRRLLLALGFCAFAGVAQAQDPARTATVYIDGFNPEGAALTGTFGADRRLPLVDSVAALIGSPVADGAASLPSNVVGSTAYYGDAPPPYYTVSDRAQLDLITAQWGGGVPRYATIVGKYVRNLLARSGASHVNLVSASFGSLIVRWLIEKDVEGLASQGKIARWLSLEGVLAGNWAASRDDLVDYLDFLHLVPIDVAHMNYSWVGAQLHSPRTEADHPLYAGILMGDFVSTDDGYDNGALSALMTSYGEWQVNDGLQAAADARFQSVTARSRLMGLPPTLSWFHDDHFRLKDDRAAWAQAATFITARRRVTVTLTSAKVTSLHEAQSWYWDWRPAEVVFESRIYSPAMEARWAIRDPVCTIEKGGGEAPLRRYNADGETQTFNHVIFDDMVLGNESTLRLVLHAYELDYDARYGVFETTQTPYDDDLGGSAISVSTLQPGTYTFQAASWSGSITVAIQDYPFAAVGVVEPSVPRREATLTISPNPSVGGVRIRLEGVLSPGSSGISLDIFDVEGRRVRRLTGDPGGEWAWDGRDERGLPSAPGVYLYRLTTAAGTRAARSLLLR